MKKAESRDLLLSVFAVALLIIAIAGVTYAIFTYTANGKQENVISTGSISMSYIESNTNVISINNAMPTLDNVGIIQKDYFDFTISSTISGVATISYEIWAKSISTENQLSTNDIKVYLEKENGGKYQEILEPTTFKETKDKGMLLYTGSFVNSESIKTNFSENYRFRMWLSDSAQIDEYSKSFKLKINIYAKS